MKEALNRKVSRVIPHASFFFLGSFSQNIAVFLEKHVKGKNALSGCFMVISK